MKAGRALELSEVQAKDLENKDKTVNAVKPPQKGTLTQPKGKQRRPQNRQESRKRDKSRKRDGKCRNWANQVTHRDTYEEDEYVYTVGRDKQPMSQVKIDEKQVEMMVDSGASVDLIDENTFRELYKGKAPEKTKRRIFSYGSPTPYPYWELSRPKYPPMPTAHKQPCTLSKVLQETSWVSFNTAKKLGVLKIVNQVKTGETRFQPP